MVALLALGGASCSSKKNTPPAPAATASSPAVASSAPPPRAPSPRRTGSSLARTVAGDALFVADEDHGVLRRVALPLNQLDTQETAVPGPPAQVLVRDGEVWATVREPGLVLGFAIEGKTLREIARIKVPLDAWGMGLSPDEKTLVVSSAWTHAVTVIDLDQRAVLKTLDVAREPRGVVFAPDGKRVYVTHLTGTALTRLDLGEGEPRATAVDLPASPLRTPKGATAGASLAYAAALSPDGSRLLVPRHALGTILPLTRAPWGWGGFQTWFGSSTLDVMRLEGESPLAPKRSHVGLVRNPVFGEELERPSETIPPSSNPTPFTQPRDLVVRATTSTVLVVSEGLNRVTEHDALSFDPSLSVVREYSVGSRYDERHVAQAGAAPQGIALSADEQTAWVFARGTYEIAQLALSADPFGGTRSSTEAARSAVVYLHLADDPLGAEASLGRRIFHDATDTVVSGGLACAGCHPEGRDDGFVWRQVREKEEDAEFHDVFVGHPLALNEVVNDGRARQTPMLAGRLEAEGPYGWHGQNKDLDARLVEGFGLHRWSGRDSSTAAEQKKRTAPLVAFLRKNGLRPPPRETRPLTAEEERGKAIFLDEKTACASCHPADSGYTSRASVPLRTPLPTRPGFAPDEDQAFKVPSLLFLAGTAPYYHDGSAPSLEELIERNGTRMGQTSHLSADDKKALVAFLRTL